MSIASIVTSLPKNVQARDIVVFNNAAVIYEKFRSDFQHVFIFGTDTKIEVEIF